VKLFKFEFNGYGSCYAVMAENEEDAIDAILKNETAISDHETKETLKSEGFKITEHGSCQAVDFYCT
jgi:hypothetical protein